MGPSLTSTALQRRDPAAASQPRIEAALEALIGRLFLRSLQLVAAAIAVSVVIACVDARTRTPPQVAVGIALSALAVAALLGHARLLAALRTRPPLLLAPTLIVAAGVVGSGGTESVYFGVVVVCVGVPVTVGRPGYALACGLLASAFELAGGLLSTRGVEWPVWTSNSAALLAAAAAGSAGVWMFARTVRDIPAVLAANDHAAERPPLVPVLPPAPSRTAGLSPREREVLALMVAGRTPAQAALELGIQLSTVRRHLRHAKRRTGARTLSELVGIAAVELE